MTNPKNLCIPPSRKPHTQPIYYSHSCCEVRNKNKKSTQLESQVLRYLSSFYIILTFNVHFHTLLYVLA